MKISIGMNIQPGAWGGGNQFGRVLTEYLRDHGETVCHDLNMDDLDIVLLVEPNIKLKISAYGHRQIVAYRLKQNRRAIVLHRINNTSEARDDSEKIFNKYRINANRVADHTIFVSQWVKDRYIESGFDNGRPSTIILNGGDHKLWNAGPLKKRGDKLKLVTHHWSGHWNKGFGIYKILDELLGDPVWGEKIDFTYIGRLPEGFNFQHAKYMEPLSGEPLAAALRDHDAYVTGAMHEAGGHHNLEACLCGLPILYIKSGSMPEYCQGYGIEFTEDNFNSKLVEMLADWEKWRGEMGSFPHTAELMCQKYHGLFRQLHAERYAVLSARPSWWANLGWNLKTLLVKE